MFPSQRPPVAAGSDYPSDPADLAVAVDALLDDARRARPPASRTPKALVAPHAPYVGAGPVAAAAWATLLPDAHAITRVVLLAAARGRFVRGLAGPGARALRTPLGAVPVDLDALRNARVDHDPSAHADERALELQLPFLQRALPRLERIVPVLVGEAAAERAADLVSALWGGRETRVVVSSNLTRDEPREHCRALDARTAARIVALDMAPLRDDEASGAEAINALLRVARGVGMRCTLLELRTSGDHAGPHERVAGWASFALYESTAAA